MAKAQNSIVVTKLAGGLGNQMFQYAFGYAVSQQFQNQLFIDTSSFELNNNDEKTTPRELELECFQLPLVKAPDEMNGIQRRGLTHRVSSILGIKSPTEICIETENFKIENIRGTGNIFLQGYWQSEDYFKKHRNELNNLFTPHEIISGDNNKMLEFIKQEATVSIHVRRGDYVTNPSANHFHGVCSLDYYERAAQLLHEKKGVCQFVVFSDDPIWVKQNIKLPYKLKYVDWNRDKQSHWDLYLMKSCNHNIIANSSFSWWGAWLNTHEDRIIVAPNKWFAQDQKLPYEIIPSNWIKL